MRLSILTRAHFIKRAVLVSTLLGSAACAAAESRAPSMAGAPAHADAPSTSAGVEQPAQPTPTPGTPGAAAATTPTSDGPRAPVGAKSAPTDAASHESTAQMIIYTGAVQMLTDETKMARTLDGVVDVAESVGGHISGRTNTSVTVKVPSARFREALTKVEPLGDITDRRVSAEDVTDQFHDIEVRLLNLRATRQRLSEFLARASNIADTLTVERELERVAQEIDVLEGKLHFLKDRSTWSQITVSVSPRPKEMPVVVTPPPPPPPPAQPRLVDLPVPWLSNLGVNRLLDLK